MRLGDGLNILQAPNETGKSTWCAFLTAMLYGINSRERDRAGFIAEKNRYAPWSGAAMRGRMDCTADGSDLTLTRETKRQTSPMGAFQAVYTGTGDEVPGLTGSACGETLLGIPREVFERSAFIRQAGLTVTADPELERRIVSLITSGEEDTSYTEASAALKRQLNLRQHHKTGQIPAAQVELWEVRRQLELLKTHQAELTTLREQTETLSAQQRETERQLLQWQQYRAVQQRRQLSEARSAAEQTEAEASELRDRMVADHVPENEAIGRLRGAIVNLEAVRRSVDKARSERDQAMKTLLRAEAAVNESPFAGQTAESAKKEASEPPRTVRWNVIPSLCVNIGGLLAAGVFGYLLDRALSAQSWHLPAAIGLFLVLGAFSVLIAHRMRLHAKKDAQDAALLKRFGTADQAVIAQMADTYCKLCEARDTAQADVNAKSATADALYTSLTSNEQGILLEVRRFAPSAFDIPTADQLLRECALRRKSLADAEAKARTARMRYELQAQQANRQVEMADTPPSEPPSQSEEALSAALDELKLRQAEVRSRIDRLTGQIAAVGDAAALSAQAEQLEQRIESLTSEYSAIALALETLSSANTALQNRFSPELGRRAAAIFSQLTGGRYSGVVLDKAFHLSAEPTGDALYRDVQLLSAGAADQLYLAVRLAICEMVLPAEKQVPLILDDALANFDDARCSAALRWLRKEAEHRQILLFTCHSREAAFFAGDKAVQIQVLTAPDSGV